MSMILYNVRRRGPYEYEKFCLNIMQLSNEVQRLERKVGGKKPRQSLKEMMDSLDTYIDANTGEDSVAQRILLTRMELED